MSAQQVELQIGGMTCASCAARIEKKLNRMRRGDGHRQLRHREGPRAPAPTASTVDELIATVEATGYTATLPAPPRQRRRRRRRVGEPADDASSRPLRQRLIVSAVLTVPVLALAMVPALQFDELAVARR